MFRSLSYYHQIEDGKVRGDPDEGSVWFQPKGGIIITKENEPSFRIPDGSAFNSGVNTEDIFILCGSNSMSDRLREGFKAVACVEIRTVALFCDRIKAELPPTASFRAERVVYYSKANEIGAKWAFPDMIAFSKNADDYDWQDEYRFCFSFTDALQHGKATQTLTIPGPNPDAKPVPVVRVPREHPLTIKSLRDICKLHNF